MPEAKRRMIAGPQVDTRIIPVNPEPALQPCLAVGATGQAADEALLRWCEGRNSQETVSLK